MIIIEIDKPTREEFLMWFKFLDDIPYGNLTTNIKEYRKN